MRGLMARNDSTKEKTPVAGEQGGVFGRDIQQANHSAEKLTATIRAKLCLAGGQRLHIAEDGCYFVTNPFGQITKFDDLASLQAHADRGAR
jgi:hypothetical protein